VLTDPQLDLSRWPASKIVTTRLQRSLDPFPAAVRRHRLASMATVMFALMADAERRADSAGERLSVDSPGLADIVTMLVGLLTATAPAA
jgi:hypothetical protein